MVHLGKLWRAWLSAQRVARRVLEEESLLLAAADGWRRERSLGRAVTKWSVGSLRRAAGYQMADRFKAKRGLREWSGWAKRRHASSMSLWIGERHWARGCAGRSVQRLRERAERSRRGRILWSMWTARRGGAARECASEVRQCWRAWRDACRIGVETKARLAVASRFWSSRAARTAWTAWRAWLEERLSTRRVLEAWRERAASGSILGAGVKGLGKWSRERAQGRALKRLAANVTAKRKAKKATAWWTRRTAKRCFELGFKENVLMVRETVKSQRNLKRVVLRKVKIHVLKEKLATAQRRRDLLRRTWKAWSCLEARAEAAAGEHHERGVKARAFRGLGDEERRGRRERWVEKLRGGRGGRGGGGGKGDDNNGNGGGYAERAKTAETPAGEKEGTEEVVEKSRQNPPPPGTSERKLPETLSPSLPPTARRGYAGIFRGRTER